MCNKLGACIFPVCYQALSLCAALTLGQNRSVFIKIQRYDDTTVGLSSLTSQIIQMELEETSKTSKLLSRLKCRTCSDPIVLWMLLKKTKFPSNISYSFDFNSCLLSLEVNLFKSLTSFCQTSHSETPSFTYYSCVLSFTKLSTFHSIYNSLHCLVHFTL